MAETVCELAATCAIFPSILFGSSEGSLSFSATICKRRCTVDTSAGLLPAPLPRGLSYTSSRARTLRGLSYTSSCAREERHKKAFFSEARLGKCHHPPARLYGRRPMSFAHVSTRANSVTEKACFCRG